MQASKAEEKHTLHSTVCSVYTSKDHTSFPGPGITMHSHIQLMCHTNPSDVQIHCFLGQNPFTLYMYLLIWNHYRT